MADFFKRIGRKLSTIKGCYRPGAVGEQNNCKLVAMLGLLSKLIRQSGRLRGNDPQRALCHPTILREASSSGAQIRNDSGRHGANPAPAGAGFGLDLLGSLRIESTFATVRPGTAKTGICSPQTCWPRSARSPKAQNEAEEIERNRTPGKSECIA